MVQAHLNSPNANKDAQPNEQLRDFWRFFYGIWPLNGSHVPLNKWIFLPYKNT